MRIDTTSKNMDFSTKHWGAFTRRFPSGLPLGTSDFITRKKNFVTTSFSTYNFSFILRGRGIYEKQGQRWEFHAPFVITQWPGEHVHYGPTHGTWDEWYMVYPHGLYPRFRRRGLIDPQRPVWPVSDPVSLASCLERFAALANGTAPEISADLIDRIAEEAILYSLLRGKDQDLETAALQTLANRMRAMPGESWDFSLLAKQHGYSESTFRRRWKAAFGTTPSSYLIQIRLSEGCRLLAESKLRIKEIAGLTGFDDEFYFSRCFHSRLGVSPRAYRRAYGVLSLS
jgi:AraC-like DNA-binding protein